MSYRIGDRVRRAVPALALLTFGLAVALTIGETGLRIAKFKYRTFPTVQFGWPEPEKLAELFVPDRDLFWVPRGYHRTLAAAQERRPAVAFLGDSCTQFGTYPERTLDRLRAVSPSLAHGINLGVGGWSSVQGLAQLQRDVLPLRPQVATFYFGWNDHWAALGSPDDAARPGALTFWLSQNSRLFQLLLKARLAIGHRLDSARPNRVDLDAYRRNLRDMACLSQRAGIRPVFITAGSNHRLGHEPEYLAERHLRKLEELVPLHNAYLAVTREVAQQTDSTLCDAAHTFEQAGEDRDRFFKKDGIHLTDDGNQALADLVAGCILAALAPRPLSAACTP